MDANNGKRIKESRKVSAARQYIGAKMAESLRDYPQGSGSAYLPTDSLLDLKARLHAVNPNVTITSVVTKLTAEALQQHPVLNSALIEGELFIYESVNVGIGVGLEDGIMMVVVKEAQDKDIYTISDELQDMIAKLKTKKLPMTDMLGSTITFSNMGMMGIEQVTPFLNPPETAIIAMGATKKQVVVDEEDDSTSIKRMTCFSMTINHAAVDGLHSAPFLLTLGKLLKDPGAYMGI